MTQLEVEVIPLRYPGFGSTHYFVGPKNDGPAVTVLVGQCEESTRFDSNVHSIGAYERPPHDGEDYGTWMAKTRAEDMLDRHVGLRLAESLAVHGAPVVKHVLEIMPPLRDPDHMQKAAKVLGRQLLVSRQDPGAPNTIVTDLVNEGIPFDSAIVTTEVIGNYKAQANPLV